MAIEWTEDLRVGIHEIDSQHKELFARINALFEACNQGRGKSEIGDTLTFLEDYTETHFKTEEHHMSKSNYPGFEDQKQQHDIFRQKLSEIKQKFANEGPGVHIVITTNHMVIDWLKNHIRTLDKAFGAYVQGR